jgi:hypothetical protein
MSDASKSEHLHIDDVAGHIPDKFWQSDTECT